MSYLWKQDMIENVGLMPIRNCNFLEAATFIPFLWDKRNQSWKDFFPLLSQRKKERKNPPFVEVLHPTASLPSSNRSTFLLLFSDIPTIQWIRSQRLEFDFFVASFQIVLPLESHFSWFKSLLGIKIWMPGSNCLSKLHYFYRKVEEEKAWSVSNPWPLKTSSHFYHSSYNYCQRLLLFYETFIWVLWDLKD